MKTFFRVVFIIFFIGVFLLLSMSESNSVRAFKSDVVYTYILEAQLQSTKWLILCAILLFAILSKLWELSDWLEQNQPQKNATKSPSIEKREIPAKECQFCRTPLTDGRCKPCDEQYKSKKNVSEEVSL